MRPLKPFQKYKAQDLLPFFFTEMKLLTSSRLLSGQCQYTANCAKRSFSNNSALSHTKLTATRLLQIALEPVDMHDQVQCPSRGRHNAPTEGCNCGQSRTSSAQMDLLHSLEAAQLLALAASGRLHQDVTQNSLPFSRVLYML